MWFSEGLEDTPFTENDHGIDQNHVKGAKLGNLIVVLNQGLKFNGN